jgi:putative chitinase
MTSEQLAQALKLTPVKAEEWIDAINETCDRFDISTPERQACFLGQCAHESGGFSALQENLNYKQESLCKVWPKRFPSIDDAEPYHKQPQKIANKVYASRMGNGDEASGEGWKYRGRGLIQLTGKDNYSACGEALGVDLVENPDLVATPQYAALSAGWFWDKNRLNAYADKNDMQGLTKKINGGTHGIEDRIARTQLALDTLMA